MNPNPTHIFDVDTESRKLKKLIGIYDPETFLPDLASLITYNGVGRIEIYPFVGLDSPLKQLSYLASLNLASDPNEISESEVASDEAWKEIVKQTISSKAGYFDLLLPKEGDDEIEYHKFYKLALPVFLDYYGTGLLNYEEQIIDKIKGFFYLFNPEISQKFKLTVEDFIGVYNAIDQVMHDYLNSRMSYSRDDAEVEAYFKQQLDAGVHPNEFQYEGENEHINEMIAFFKGRGEILKIKIEDVHKHYDKEKVDIFFSIFTLQRKERDYLYYTQKAIILEKPIYKLKDGRYLIFEIKQLLQAAFDLLDNYLSDKENGLSDRFFKRRGKFLHQKTHKILDRFFKGEAYIYSEYRTKPKGDGQDLLLLHKGKALVLEIKAGYEAKPHSVPKNAVKVFESIYLNFKKNIQKGYEQVHRILKLFLDEQDFDIYDENNIFQYHVKAKRYPDAFGVIVTADKFRRAQIDLSHQLKLKEDGIYPWSICIDDLEIILLTLRKLKKGPAELFRYLYLREELHGRIESDDELEIWGLFLESKNFKIPDDERMHLRTNPEMSQLYDELYETGLGFEDEKRLNLKKDKHTMTYDPGKWIMEQRQKK